MNVYVVHGAPLSGKTTYVQERKGPNDLVFDFDLVMAAISGLPIHEHNERLVGYVLDIRDLIIARLKSENKIGNAWIITTRITDRFKQSLIGLNAEYIEMKIDKHTAKKRLRDNPDGRDIEMWEKVIDNYFMATQDYSAFYKSKKWERKRIAILKRDGYKCREASRYGQVVAANTVHHIIPIAERPDLKLDDRNLISLTETNHERMHVKFSSRLSKLGEGWRERTLRKYPGLRSPPPLK